MILPAGLGRMGFVSFIILHEKRPAFFRAYTQNMQASAICQVIFLSLCQKYEWVSEFPTLKIQGMAR
jgi:hypothetical protein